MRVSPALRRHSPGGSRHLPKRFGVALLLGAAGVSLAMGIADLRSSQRLHAEGMATKARVSDKHIERRRSWSHRHLSIEYRTAAGQIINARDDVAHALYERVAVGDTIAVRYLPTEPDVHSLGATSKRDTFMLWIAGLWLLLAGVYGVFGT